MRLNNADNQKKLYLVVILLTAAVSWRVNYGATRTLEHADTSVTSSDMEHKVKFNQPATIWIVNQPKCGTTSLTTSIKSALHCQPHEKWPSTEKVYSDCPGGQKVFWFHGKIIENVKKIVDKDMDQVGTKPDRCIAITAVRNPFTLIPSRFFHDNKERFCDGAQSKEEILEEYKEYLLGPMPSRQVATTAYMLRAFGAQNILEAMQLLSENGYAFLNRPKENGPWAGCELLFLQIDYNESNSNLNKGLNLAVEGAKMITRNVRIEECPKAEDNYHALRNYRIPDEQIDVFAKTNQDFHDVITYYKNQQTNIKRKLNH